MTQAYLTSEVIKEVVSREREFPYFDFQGSEASKVFAGAEFLERCFPYAVLILCKINHPAMAYVSNNSKRILGYPAAYIKNLTPEEYFSLVHPEDAKAVGRCYERMSKQVKSSDYRPENWKFSFHYRIQSSNGEYISIIDQKNAFQYEKGHYIHFSLIQLMERQVPEPPFLGIYKKGRSGFQKFMEYMPVSDKRKITTREKEILQCIESGMRANEIAQILHISAHTVRNHRSNLLKKINAKTSIHAVRQAKILGII
jgi:DNA-binding CsgD family transcriptional regulator